jgi:hypothetical protein
VSAEGLFVTSGDLSDVVLNWYGQPIEKLASYAEAYHSTARRLFEKSSPDELRDINACPVVLLYRHSLELYLKEILINGQRILQHDSKPFLVAKDILNHDLCKLWRELIRLHEQLGWSWEADLAAHGSVIEEFHSTDMGGFSFRYPVEKKSGDATTRQDFRFNLRHFCCRMDQVLNKLDEMSCNVAGVLDQSCSAG